MESKRSSNGSLTSLFFGELLAGLPSGGRVLDLGCGNGSFGYHFYPHLQIVAVDVAESPAAAAWPSNVQFRRGAAEALPLPDASFDLVIANFVFEHTHDFERAIGEADRVLVPGGALFLSIPNAKSFEDELYRALFAGGGHLQRFGLESILRTIYARTRLKLMAFADWPAGFTFFTRHEGLRRFTLTLVSALNRSGNTDLTLRSNFLMAFRKESGIGYRLVSRVCSHCGGGNVEELPQGEAGPRWQCRACGRTTEPEKMTIQDIERLEAEMAEFLSPLHGQPASSIGGSTPVRGQKAGSIAGSLFFQFLRRLLRWRKS